MATSPAKYRSGGLLGVKSKLANRLSGTYNRKSYSIIKGSPSIDDFKNESKIEDWIRSPLLNRFSIPIPKSIPSPNLLVYNDYLYTLDNYVLFYVQFTNVQNGFFKDIISLNSPVQYVIKRYSQFFQGISDISSLNLFVGPKSGVHSQLNFARVRSVGVNSPRKLSHHASLAEQSVNSSHVLIISPPSEANFTKEAFHAYLKSKSEHTQFVERWLPAVHGYVPLDEDSACVVGASLYKLSSLNNLVVTSNPKDFIHKSIIQSKITETKIEKALERISNESAESIMKLCLDTIQANFLSAAIIFNVSYNLGGGIHHDQSVYMVINSQTIILMQKNDPSKIIFNIQLIDTKGWKNTGEYLDIRYVNKYESSSDTDILTSHLIVKSQDAPSICSTLTAVGYALHSK